MVLLCFMLGLKLYEDVKFNEEKDKKWWPYSISTLKADAYNYMTKDNIVIKLSKCRSSNDAYSVMSGMNTHQVLDQLKKSDSEYQIFTKGYKVGH